MKIVLAGAFSNLGRHILKRLVEEGHEVIATGRSDKGDEALKGRYTFYALDVTEPPKDLPRIFRGADMLISTIGLTTASKTHSCYDIDYRGNKMLIRLAERAGVKKIHYVSVLACDRPDAVKVPMLDAKHRVEKLLLSGKTDYVIYRPTGYFYDILKVFRPYIEKGKMQLLKGYGDVKANVVDCKDLADFIVDHLTDSREVYEIGGKETWSYEEMARLCFEAAGKPVQIAYVPKFMFSVLAILPKIRKEGKRDVILFSKFTLSHDLVGRCRVGEASFQNAIREAFGGEEV